MGNTLIGNRYSAELRDGAIKQPGCSQNNRGKVHVTTEKHQMDSRSGPFGDSVVIADVV